MKTLKKQFYFNLNSDRTVVYILIFFFIHQIYQIFIGGSTYDTIDLRFGSHKLYDKLIAILNLDFDNAIFDEFTTTEYFGLVLIFPIYIFSHIINYFGYELVSAIFISNDSFIYFLMHLFLSLYVVTALYFISKLLKKNWTNKNTNIFIIFLILTPSFTGHALFNLKDIPYLLQLMIFNIYVLNEYSKNKFSEINIKRILVAAFLISLSASIRINAYLFICFTFAYIFLYNFKSKMNLVKYIYEVFLSLFLSIIFLFILSPQGWLRPVPFLLKSINHQFNHGWIGSTLVNGKYVLAQDVTPTYLIEWFTFRLPLNLIIGFFIFIFLIRKIDLSIYSKFSLVFILSVFILFPILRPTAYDGLRHFLFLLPYFVIIFTEVLNYLNLKSRLRFLLPLLIFYAFFTQFGLGPYKYTYFNELVNINKAAYFCSENIDGCGNWATDYWGFKGKEVGNYLNENYLEILDDKRILVCKPKHTVKSYLNDNINLTDVNDLIIGEQVFIFTYHRPRFNEDSCYFNFTELTPECSLYKEFYQRIRTSKISLAYLSICNIS